MIAPDASVMPAGIASISCGRKSRASSWCRAGRRAKSLLLHCSETGGQK
jgi:hypothetical protein